MPLEPGTSLGPYRIVARLAAGGMGEVYQAVDTRLGRDVAVKILSEALARDAKALDRFTREARAVAALSHPNILSLYEFDREEETTFVVTELLEGETLRQRLLRGPLPWREAAAIGVEIAQGLAAAHAKGILHRDLKPENLFLTSDGRVKILDFGLALVVDRPAAFSDDDHTPTAELMRGPKEIIGTVMYMSPEQLRGGAVSEASDIFSLGAVLYETIAGFRAFGKETVADSVAAVLRETPRNISELSAVPAELADVIHCCIAKAPAERFHSAGDLAFALKILGSGSSPLPASLIRSKKRRALDSIAVLPFSVRGGEAEGEYLADGLTESLISSLSELPRMRVMASTTVFRLKASAATPQHLGQTLGVGAVVAGRIELRERRVRVVAELVAVDDGARMWGTEASGEVGAFVDVQRAIADAIVARLRPRLSTKKKTRATAKQTTSSEAYHAHVRGRHFWNKRTPDGMRRAIEYFQQAIETDPVYALAYSGLADCYSLLCNYRVLAPRDGYPRAKAAAARALEIDPKLAEAHTSLGYVRMMHDWDLAGARESFERALAINTNYPTAHHWYSHCFEAEGDYDRAIAEIRRAQSLDPLSHVIECIVGFHLHVARRYDDAIAQFRRVIENEPSFARAHSDLADVLFTVGDLDAAAAAQIRSKELINIPGAELFVLKAAYESGGGAAFLEQMAALLEARASVSYVSPVERATVAIRRKRIDEAFDWMEAAREERCDVFVFLRRPLFDPLRDDPRFEAIRQVIGHRS